MTGPTRPPRFVLDVSVAVPWVVDAQSSKYTDDVLFALIGNAAVAPSGWPAEYVAALLAAERRGLCTAAEVETFLAQIAGFALEIDQPSAAGRWADVLAIARSRRWAISTAATIELARRRGLPLATISPRLRRAATAANVPIFAP